MGSSVSSMTSLENCERAHPPPQYKPLPSTVSLIIPQASDSPSLFPPPPHTLGIQSLIRSCKLNLLGVLSPFTVVHISYWSYTLAFYIKYSSLQLGHHTAEKKVIILLFHSSSWILRKTTLIRQRLCSQHLLLGRSQAASLTFDRECKPGMKAWYGGCAVVIGNGCLREALGSLEAGHLV